MSKKMINRLLQSLVFLLSIGVIHLGCENPTIEEELAANGPIRIVNGEDTNIEDVPWQSLIYMRSVNDEGEEVFHTCGGSIIDEEWILTAAHCVDEYSTDDLFIFAGLSERDEISDSDTQVRFASSTIVHPQYNSNENTNDIALIHLDEALDLKGDRAQAIWTATDDDAAAFAPGEMATASGWGRTDNMENSPVSNVLQSVQIPIVDSDLYNQVMTEVYKDTGIDPPLVGEDALVAGDFGEDNAAGAYSGDSGGPLVVESESGPILVGVVSNGSVINDVSYMLPTVYMNVAHFSNWIEDNVKKFSSTRFTTKAIEFEMTANNTPKPFVASASSGNGSAWKAFDVQTNYWTQWISGYDFGDNESNFASLKIDVGTRKFLKTYVIRGRYDSLKNRLPKSWVFQGSNADNPDVDSPVNSAEWKTLDRQTDIDFSIWGRTNTNRTLADFDLSKSASFSNYRLVVTEVNGSSVVDIMQIDLYE